MTHCENCIYWANGYCRLRKQETADGVYLLGTDSACNVDVEKQIL